MLNAIAAIVGALLGLGGGALLAEYCWQYVDGTQANDPLAWEYTSFVPPSGADPGVPSDQMLIDEHANWHCVNGGLGVFGSGSGPDIGDPGYGNIFLAFHKQIINNFNVWRDGLPC